MAYNEALALRMRARLKGQRRLVEKRMFGGIGFLVHGNLACGLYKNDMVVRLGKDQFAAALKKPGAHIFDITGKPMQGWLLVSEKGCKSEAALNAWIKESLSFAKSLPAK
jgi:TfoX/Sxy family transcriptional regulator of competence genes